MKTDLFACSWLLILLAAAGCGSSDSGRPSTHTYSSTSTVGDYAEWTITGSSLTTTWQVTNSDGAVAKTFQLSANCGAADATYAYRTCTISSASCTDGTEVCGNLPSGDFEMLEVPGVALFIQVAGNSATHPTKELHVGLLKDAGSCAADISGDYPYIRLGVGESDIFGIYRTNPDLSSIVHADFKMVSTNWDITPSVGYATQDGPNNNGEVTATTVCANGVRTLTLANSGIIRSMVSPSGLFVLDLPSGDGGAIAFKTSNAAALADLASRSFAGLAFPDVGEPAFLAATTGAVSATQVPVTSLLSEALDDIGTGLSFKPLSTSSWTATSPSYPDFTDDMTAYKDSGNVLHTNYATPSAIPGIFVIDGELPDSGRTVVGAMRYNGKVVIFGAVYNWRDTPARLENTGAFLLFEK